MKEQKITLTRKKLELMSTLIFMKLKQQKFTHNGENQMTVKLSYSALWLKKVQNKGTPTEASKRL